MEYWIFDVQMWVYKLFLYWGLVVVLVAGAAVIVTMFLGDK